MVRVWMFVVALSLVATAHADPVRDAVDAGNYFFVKAFDARDSQAIADLYSEDARVVAPGSEPAAGRPAIAAFWATAMQGTRAVRLETLAVEGAGDFAIEEGVAHLTADDGSESAARYLVVWKRVGRRWHLHRDIWNTGPAGAVPTEPAATTPVKLAPVAEPPPGAEPAAEPEAAPPEVEGPLPGETLPPERPA